MGIELAPEQITEMQKYIDELRVQVGKGILAGASTYAADTKSASEIRLNMLEAKAMLIKQQEKERRSYQEMMDKYLKALHNHEKNKTHLPELLEDLKAIQEQEFITEDEMKL